MLLEREYGDALCLNIYLSIMLDVRESSFFRESLKYAVRRRKKRKKGRGGLASCPSNNMPPPKMMPKRKKVEAELRAIVIVMNLLLQLINS